MSTIWLSRSVSLARSPRSWRADLRVSGRAATSLSIATGQFRRDAIRSNRTGEEDGSGDEHSDHQDPELPRRAGAEAVGLVVEGGLDLVDQQELLGVAEVFLRHEYMDIAHGVDAVDV